MTLFIISLVLLIAGYAGYAALVERSVAIDTKAVTPAFRLRDNVDYIPLPTWRVFLIQFLNIAGLGPIFGAIMGVMFGPAAFLWIVFGTIFGGAVHDFLSGTLSLRSDGASLPELIGSQLNTSLKRFVTLFSVLLLLLVSAVFVVTPAGIIASMTPDYMNVTFWLCAIFIYYILATLLPIDKLIGSLYPVFGLSLLFMAFGIMIYLFIADGVTIPVDISEGFSNRYYGAADSQPIFPMMFVSIACGAISGFHATQSPMMARCLTNERLARPVFYGAMVAEGIVALIWAAAAITFTGGYDGLGEYMSQPGHAPGSLVKDISMTWLGSLGGVLAMIGVVAAPITTGDTALRSARLILADFFHIRQTTFLRRMAMSLPLFAVVIGLLMIDFTVLWRYFAWSNQMLSVFTLWAVTVWLSRRGGYWFLIPMIPAMFMTGVCVTYLLFAPEGFGIDLTISTAIGIASSLIVTTVFFTKLPGFYNGLASNRISDPTI